jgi:hypothetical protein
MPDDTTNTEGQENANDGVQDSPELIAMRESVEALKAEMAQVQGQNKTLEGIIAQQTLAETQHQEAAQAPSNPLGLPDEEWEDIDSNSKLIVDFMQNAIGSLEKKVVDTLTLRDEHNLRSFTPEGKIATEIMSELKADSSYEGFTDDELYKFAKVQATKRMKEEAEKEEEVSLFPHTPRQRGSVRKAKPFTKENYPQAWDAFMAKCNGNPELADRLFQKAKQGIESGRIAFGG